MSDGKAPPFKFATNIPVRVRIKSVYVRPGKPWQDPATQQTKMLPAQVSIGGAFDGVETIAFLPGAVWKNIKALSGAGLIAPQDTDALELVDSPTRINLLTDEDFTATLAKPAGAKYADMTYVPCAAASPAPSKRIPPPSGAPPQSAPLPFDIPSRAEEAVGPMDGPMPGPLVGDEPPLTPREVAARVEPNAKREAFLAFYADTYRVLLEAMSASHIGSCIPLTSEAVQAATATCVIQMNQKGLLP